jgi:hypothetical protein
VLRLSGSRSTLQRPASEVDCRIDYFFRTLISTRLKSIG